MNILEQIKQLGYKNQIWLIDHSDTVLDITDEQLFFGLGSGKYGGRIVEESPRPKPINGERNQAMPTEYYHFQDLYCRNIQMDEIKIPKNRLVTFTGESGCDKSILVNECIAKDFLKRYPKDKLVIVGQDRNQSITSRSTVATEFQCVHLVSELFANSRNPHTLFIFDEPSKGLSQNILNQFIDSVRVILQDESVSIMMIEHNAFMHENSDFIVDFGKRQLEPVKHLDIVSHDDYYRLKNRDDHAAPSPITSKLKVQNGITHFDENHIVYFKKAENVYKRHPCHDFKLPTKIPSVRFVSELFFIDHYQL